MLLDSPFAFGSSPGHDRGSDVDGMRAALGKSGFAVIGAWEDARLVAAAGLQRDEQPKRAHVATIWGVYVTPSARGRGAGRAVVSGAVDLARTWPGVERMYLSVSEASIAARGLYESLGFVAWGVEPDCLRWEGSSYAESHMGLALVSSP